MFAAAWPLWRRSLWQIAFGGDRGIGGDSIDARRAFIPVLVGTTVATFGIGCWWFGRLLAKYQLDDAQARFLLDLVQQFARRNSSSRDRIEDATNTVTFDPLGGANNDVPAAPPAEGSLGNDPTATAAAESGTATAEGAAGAWAPLGPTPEQAVAGGGPAAATERPMGLRTLLAALQACDRVSADSVTGPFQVSAGDDEAPVVCFQFRMSHFTCKAFLAHGAQDEGSQHLKLQTTFEDNRRSLGEEQRFFVANEWNATKRYTRLKCGTGAGAGRSSVFTLEYDVLVPSDTPHSWGLTLVSQTLRMWYTSMVACVMHIVEPRDMPFATHEMITANTLAVSVREEDTGLLRECCPICFEQFQVGEKVRRLPCMHIFHLVGGDTESSQGRHCNIDRHLICDKQCPVCKTPIDIMERLDRQGVASFSKNASGNGATSSGTTDIAFASAARSSQDAPGAEQAATASMPAAVSAGVTAADVALVGAATDRHEPSLADPVAAVAASAHSSATEGGREDREDNVAAPPAGGQAPGQAIARELRPDGAQPVDGARATDVVAALRAAGGGQLSEPGSLGVASNVDMTGPAAALASIAAAHEPVATATATVAAASALVAAGPDVSARSLGAAAAVGLPAQAAELERAVRSLQSRWLQIQDVVAGMQQMLQYIEESQSAIRAAEAAAGVTATGNATVAATDGSGAVNQTNAILDAVVQQSPATEQPATDGLMAVSPQLMAPPSALLAVPLGEPPVGQAAIHRPEGPPASVDALQADSVAQESAAGGAEAAGPTTAELASGADVVPPQDTPAAQHSASSVPDVPAPTEAVPVAEISTAEMSGAVVLDSVATATEGSGTQPTAPMDGAAEIGEGHHASPEAMLPGAHEATHEASSVPRASAAIAVSRLTAGAMQATLPPPRPRSQMPQVLPASTQRSPTSPAQPDLQRSGRCQPFTEAEQVCMAFIWRQRQAAALAAAASAAASATSTAVVTTSPPQHPPA